MTETIYGHEPHPHIGGRTNALRALAAWRMEWPGTPRVVAVTGDSGSGRSRLLTGFLMLCDPQSREQLHLDRLDPATVPPEMPAPAATNVSGLTCAQFLWAVADHHGLDLDRADDVYEALAGLDEIAPLIVLDVAEAGPLRSTDEPARLVGEVLAPLAAIESTRLVVELPRALATELAQSLPAGEIQVMDLDDPQWADPDGLVRQAEAALDPQFGAPDLPFVTDAGLRGKVAAAVAHRAGTSPLVVQLTTRCLLTAPEGFGPVDEEQLPDSVAAVPAWHAQRLGTPVQVLHSLLAPLALAEHGGVPFDLWPGLVDAVAGQERSQAIGSAMRLVGPFVKPVEDPDDLTGERMLLRLVHPAVGDEVRAALPPSRAPRSRIAMALLEAVPDQDWSKADAYVRDHIAGHALDAGLLPQLLTDPGLFVHADPVRLRAAVEAVPPESLGTPARTYLRVAPLMTRNELPALGRAALLETAFVEDGLPEYADTVRRLGLDVPWHTLWHLPVTGVDEVTVAEVPTADGSVRPVAVLVVPSGTPGAWAAGPPDDVDPRGGLLVHDLLQSHLYPPADPALLSRPAEEDRAAAPFGLSQGADYVRIWDRAAGEPVAAFLSDQPLVGADLSPGGILLVATHSGVKALRIHATAPPLASEPHAPEPHAPEPQVP